MKIFWLFNVLLLYLVVGVLSYSYYQEFVNHSPPCPYCIMQRFFVAGVGVPLLFNIFGPVSYKNVGASILSCVLGGLISLYQWANFLLNGGVSTSPKVLALPMYIWAAFLFFFLILILCMMLFFMKEGILVPRNWFINLAIGLFLFVLLGEVVVTAKSCGFFLC